MIKMQTALLILTVFIACLYFSAKRKNDINHKLFSSMLIMGIVTGIMMIVNGARLQKKKSEILI